MRSPKRRFEIRRNRVRSNIFNVSSRLRLSVFKSGRHVYAQIIDDTLSVTLASASTLDKSLKLEGKRSSCNKIMAQKVGSELGKRAVARGVTKVVFDKGGYKYHGVIKALAEGAREQLDF